MIEAVQSISSTQNLHKENEFVRTKNVAQYGGSDYANAIRVERGISLDEAFEIANSDPEIDYFFYVKGLTMVLVGGDPNNDPLGLVEYTEFIYDDGRLGEDYCRIFRHGDVVFFKNEGKWLGDAPGLADVYSKQ